METFFWSPPGVTTYNYKTTSLAGMADSTATFENLSVGFSLDKVCEFFVYKKTIDVPFWALKRTKTAEYHKIVEQLDKCSGWNLLMCQRKSQIFEKCSGKSGFLR